MTAAKYGFTVKTDFNRFSAGLCLGNYLLALRFFMISNSTGSIIARVN
jgi:hypothetical protein